MLILYININQILLDQITFTAFLTISIIFTPFKAFNLSSAAYLFKPIPPIKGSAALTIAAKVPGIANA